MESAGPQITIELIDPSDGRLLQSWSFDQPRITIGRDGGGDIVLADPYISRLHAELKTADDGTWRLFSHGRNGVYVDGHAVDEVPLASGTRFRLGPSGPMFSLGHDDVPIEQSATSTLALDTAPAVLLTLDRQEAERQAQEVSETDYFRQLQQKARDLRKSRKT